MDSRPSRPGVSVSVVICTYNRCRALGQTLDSLERQSSASPFEVVVAVDGSRDGTVDSLQARRSAVPLRWLWQPNAGAAAARNAAAKLASGGILIFLDDDQIADAGLVAAHVDAHRRHPGALVQGAYPLAPTVAIRGASLAYESSRVRGTGVSIPAGQRLLWGGNFSISRERWQAVGGFDEDFRAYGGEDTDFGLRVAALGAPHVFEPLAQSYHLHKVGYLAFARNAFSEGRATVRLCRKHGLPPDALPGNSFDGVSDRAIGRIWRSSPSLATGIGILATAVLWLADRTRVRPFQLAAARVVRRIYRIGGITSALGAAKSSWALDLFITASP